jgi:hypothetical protein
MVWLFWSHVCTPYSKYVVYQCSMCNKHRLQVIVMILFILEQNQESAESKGQSINNISREGGRVSQKLIFANRGEGGVKEKLTISY